MRISGHDLLGLLEKDGWTRRGQTTSHGVYVYKQFPDERRPRHAVIKDTRELLPPSYLSYILGPKQTGLLRTGLEELERQYG